MTQMDQHETDVGRVGQSTAPIADGGTPDSPVIEREELTASVEGAGTVGGVLLAAGPGERYDGPFKLLETVEGEPIVRRAAKALLSGGLAEVVVVVGHEAAAVREALEDLDVEVIENDQYRDGQSASLHVGVDIARERNWDAVVFGLGDMPFVTGEAVDLVLRGYAGGHGSIIAAGFEGKRGNPTLFDARYYDDLLAVDGDTGGRPVLVGSSDVAVVETGEPGVLRDVDTREDYEAYT